MAEATAGALTTREVWDRGYGGAPLVYDEEALLLRDVFARHVTPGGSCFEVGCYPGNYLIYLARRFGCTVAGIDYTSHLDRARAHLAAHGVRAELIEGDFLSFRPERRYDFVYSLGFVEHFRDFGGVIGRHVGLVRPGGKVLIAVPNFRGLQGLLRAWLDRANLRRHMLAAMDTRALEGALSRGGVRVIERGYHRTADFWVYPEPRPLLQTRAVRVAERAARWLDARVDAPNPLTSPYLYVVGEKSA